MTDIAERLRNLDTCAVSDAMDSLGRWGTVISLRSLSVTRRIAGKIVTVKLGPAREDIPKRHLCTAAIEGADAGDVIVVENHHRPDAAGWGGILSQAAATKGISGTICDGPVRDVDESIQFDYPVFARGAVSSTARGRIAEHAWNVPVKVHDIDVSPGDYVIADSSGSVFVPADIAEDVVAKAEDIAAREAAMGAAVRDGKPVSQVMGGDYESMLVKS